MSVQLSAQVDLTPRQIAEAFAELGDEEQAQVFIEVAAIAEGWEHQNMDQWYAVGRHLVTCSCSTEAARELVRRLARGVQSRVVLT